MCARARWMVLGWVLVLGTFAPVAISAELPQADGKSDGTGEFTAGVLTSSHVTAGVPADLPPLAINLTGVFWRARLASWFQLGGSLAGGGSEEVDAIRFNLLSGQFEVPLFPEFHPYLRLGSGMQSEIFQPDDFDTISPSRGEGGFVEVAPGAVIRTASWLQIHIEFHATLLSRAIPEGGEAVQTGVSLGVGFVN